MDCETVSFRVWSERTAGVVGDEVLIMEGVSLHGWGEFKWGMRSV